MSVGHSQTLVAGDVSLKRSDRHAPRRRFADGDHRAVPPAGELGRGQRWIEMYLHARDFGATRCAESDQPNRPPVAPSHVSPSTVSEPSDKTASTPEDRGVGGNRRHRGAMHHVPVDLDGIVMKSNLGRRGPQRLAAWWPDHPSRFRGVFGSRFRRASARGANGMDNLDPSLSSATSCGDSGVRGSGPHGHAAQAVPRASSSECRSARWTPLRGRAGRLHYPAAKGSPTTTNDEHGLVLRRYWTNVFRCAIVHSCHQKEPPDHRWEPACSRSVIAVSRSIRRRCASAARRRTPVWHRSRPRPTRAQLLMKTLT